MSKSIAFIAMLFISAVVATVPVPQADATEYTASASISTSFSGQGGLQ